MTKWEVVYSVPGGYKFGDPTLQVEEVWNMRK
jgi:hypothetical protein